MPVLTNANIYLVSVTKDKFGGVVEGDTTLYSVFWDEQSKTILSMQGSSRESKYQNVSAEVQISGTVMIDNKMNMIKKDGKLYEIVDQKPYPMIFSDKVLYVREYNG